MTRWLTIVALLPLLGLASSVASPGPKATEGRIAVVVVDAAGGVLPGVGLSLCPFESGQVHARSAEDDPCLFRVSRTDGSAVFETVAPGRYRLTGSLTGFADTSVFPLSIAAPRSGPKAPGTVKLVLNPVCYDC